MFDVEAMKWTMVLMMGLMLMLAGPALAQPVSPPDEVRHSGRILEVAPDGSAIVLMELVAWTGPGTGERTRSIRLTPRTSIRLLEWTGRWDNDRTSMPGWDARGLDRANLQRGDFVTVTTDDDQRAVAVAVDVIRPDAP